MAKRKAYMEKAEELFIELLQFYASEHDTIPANIDTILKGACTRARNKVLANLHKMALEEIKPRRHYHHFNAMEFTEYNKTRHTIMKGLTHVQDIRLRQHNS